VREMVWEGKERCNLTLTLTLPLPLPLTPTLMGWEGDEGTEDPPRLPWVRRAQGTHQVGHGDEGGEDVLSNLIIHQHFPLSCCSVQLVWVRLCGGEWKSEWKGQTVSW
jgi:hypothetical protein